MKIISFILVLLIFFGLQSVAQDHGYLEGVIKADDTGETLIGAHIKMKGDISTGAITDVNGAYSIKISEGHHTFVISFTGMETATIEVDIKSGEITKKYQIGTLCEYITGC